MGNNMTTSNTPSLPSTPPVPDYPERLPIQPLAGPIDVELAVPGSKSITNRALLLGALADGPVTLTGALFANDPFYMLGALCSLGFEVEARPEESILRVVGRNGTIPTKQADLFIGNAGTAMRFLTAGLSIGEGHFRLDGNARMRERPIRDLVDGLQKLGVPIRCEQNNGCPPVIIDAAGLPGGRAQMDGSRSSQFVSAVLMAAPYARTPLNVEVVGEFVSRPYVELTLATMNDFGVTTAREGERIFHPAHGQRYRAGEYAVEGDASAATYFLAAAAILGGRAVVTNLRSDSPQGDAAFADMLARMGCQVRRGFLPGGTGVEIIRDPKTKLAPLEADLNDMPDTVQTLAAVALFADGRSRFTDIGNLRLKETDRLSALHAELTRLGAEVKEGPDWLEVAPGQPRGAEIQTYDDHRMAMSMALVGLARPDVAILNPACVAKTYPLYFEDLAKLRRV
jgi:3-phosphoshikimate 1-carboxyvinyltransferase